MTKMDKRGLNDEERLAYLEGRKCGTESSSFLEPRDLRILLSHVHGQYDSIAARVHQLAPTDGGQRKPRMGYRQQGLTEEQHQLAIEYRRKQKTDKDYTWSQREAMWTYNLMFGVETPLEPEWCDYDTFILHIQYLYGLENKRNPNLPTQAQTEAHFRFLELERQHATLDGENSKTAAPQDEQPAECPPDDFSSLIVKEFGFPPSPYMQSAQRAWTDYAVPAMKKNHP